MLVSLAIVLLSGAIFVALPGQVDAASYYCYAPSKVGWKDGHNYVWGYVPRNLVHGKPWKLWPTTWLRQMIGGPFDPWFVRDDGYYEAGFPWLDQWFMRWILGKDFLFCREV